MRFGKSDQQRYNDTLDVFASLTATPYMLRALAVQTVDKAYPKLGLDRKAMHQLSSSLSIAKAMPSAALRGNEGERRKRRALILLSSALLKNTLNDAMIPARTAEILAMPLGALDDELQSLILKAATAASSLGAAYVFQTVLGLHPLRFLRTNKLMIQGVPTGAANYTQAGVAAGGRTYRNVLPFHFCYDPGKDIYRINTYGMQGCASHRFDSVSVPAIYWDLLPGVGALPGNFSQVRGTELIGADFMVTTQFTGCAFLVKGSGGTLRAAHISPAGPTIQTPYGSGFALANRMISSPTAIVNGPPDQTFVYGSGAGNLQTPKLGPSFYPAQNRKMMTIFGLRKGGGDWRLYSQVINDDTDRINQHYTQRII